MVGTSGTVFFGNGAAYTTYGNTVPVMAPAEYHPTFPQAPAAPTTPSAYPTIVYPQPLYYPQQYQYQPTVCMIIVLHFQIFPLEMKLMTNVSFYCLLHL